MHRLLQCTGENSKFSETGLYLKYEFNIKIEMKFNINFQMNPFFFFGGGGQTRYILLNKILGTQHVYLV